MSERPGATQLDQLVPPVGPRWRPAALVVVVIVAAMGVAYVWGNGWVTPMVDRPQRAMWGGDDQVHLGINIQARGADVELVDIWDPPPGLAVHSVRVIDAGQTRIDPTTNRESHGRPLPATIPTDEPVL
ncbi:MAG: hypothetical protein ACLFWR_13515, partial [Acidimicrobiales bacterium]